MAQQVGVDAHRRDDEDDDRHFDEYVASIQRRFDAALEAGPVFQTDASEVRDEEGELTGSDGIFLTYLSKFPDASRQYHTCNCCRSFFRNYGGLVSIADDGSLVPVAWDPEDAPPYYRSSVAAVARVVRRAKVTGLHVADTAIWGTARSPKSAKHGGRGEWTHYAVRGEKAIITGDLTAYQYAAAKKQAVETVETALREFPKAVVDQAAAMLRSETLYRSEKVLGPVEFLAGLHAIREPPGLMMSDERRKNLVWRAAATAPEGFLHPRASMAGTLLEDLVAGVSQAEVKRRFSEKMHPAKYQRPTAAPTAGAVAAAEKLFEERGLADSLPRRYAKLEDVLAFAPHWHPLEEPKPAKAAGGIFGHLKTRDEVEQAKDGRAVVNAPTMSWAKFKRDHLPMAKRIDVLVPYSGNFGAITAQANPNAKPILQWDMDHVDERARRRNGFSWYMYTQGSTATQWSLTGGTRARVTAITPMPCHWQEPAMFRHHPAGVFFLLEGARETDRVKHGGLFPETLRSDLHEVRRVIEAYSNEAEMAGREEATACGLIFNDRSGNVRLLVTDANGVRTDYTLDRLE